MTKKFLYAYFGNIQPNSVDIPGHFMYQPFLIEEICRRLCDGDVDYKVDIYSYVAKVDPNINFCAPINFTHFFDPVNNMLNSWSLHLGTKEYRMPFIQLDEVLERIQNDYYDYLLLKARFRNTSTHGKKLYDVKKFEKICDLAINRNVPILIVDTDLALPKIFIDDVINAHDNVKIIGLGDVSKAYPNLDKTKILHNIPLYGISTAFMNGIYKNFEEQPNLLAHYKQNNKILLYYGNVAFSNYKEGHTKNYEVLEYLIKLTEEKIFSKMNGYIIGKVEDKRFIADFGHINRYDRDKICAIHKQARLSVNISKILYEKTDFNPARLTESWVYGILPLTYSSDGTYQNNRTLVFKNYTEFLECVKLYLIDTEINDYYRMFMQAMKNCIDYRQKEEAALSGNF